MLTPEKVPGLAVGESIERVSLLPPALSESLHIPPPPALPELQARWEPSVLNTTTHRINLRITFHLSSRKSLFLKLREKILRVLRRISRSTRLIQFRVLISKNMRILLMCLILVI